jgi:tetratricopeptide (TPR) repeat protein
VQQPAAIHRLLLALLAFSLPSGAAFAHLGVHEQIEALDRQIEADPANAELHLRRGDLHRIHGDWPASEKDFATARRLQPDLADVDLCEGQMRLEAGDPARAVQCLDRFLGGDPGHVKGLVLRAQALAAQAKYCEAAADYDAAIAQFHGDRKPRPEMYLERARAQAALGAEYLYNAVCGLDDGIARLGPVVSLELFAVELEVKRGDFEAALARVRAAASAAQNKATWLVREAEILEAWGRLAEARQAYVTALGTLKKQGARQTPASRQLEERLEKAIDRLVDH